MAHRSPGGRRCRALPGPVNAASQVPRCLHKRLSASSGVVRIRSCTYPLKETPMPIVDLPMRELGRTGLHVTMLGYGAMELRGAPRGRDVTEAQAETILNAALDAGINYLDTSIDYGLSEERIGHYVAHRRSEYYLASKCDCMVGADPAPRRQRNQHV